MLKITIPATLPGLNEYVKANRANAYKGSRVSRDAHYICRLGALPIRGKMLPKCMPVCRWYEPNRRRDKDNIAMAKKFILDSLQEMNVLENDGWAQIMGFIDEFYIDKMNPRVEVLLYEPTDADEFFKELRRWTMMLWKHV